MAMATRTSAGGRTRVGKYGLGRTLGEGTFTKVKFARNIQTGENVGIKILDKDKVLKHKMIGQKNKSKIKKTIEELDEKKKETLKAVDKARAGDCYCEPCHNPSTYSKCTLK